MERDAVISHGMSGFLQESMLTRADDYEMAICNKTGTIAIYNPKKNIMLSPSADGPLQYMNSIDTNESTIRQVSYYGRDFSIVRVPYSLKLLIQEMQAINIRMSIITEDNVSQMENMKTSKNIDLLLGKPNASIDMITKQIQKQLDSEESNESIYEVTPIESIESIDSKENLNSYSNNSPPYIPGSPVYVPPNSYNDTSNDSPQYIPGSPVYVPSNGTSGASNDSLKYDPNSSYNEFVDNTHGNSNILSNNAKSIVYNTGSEVHLRGDSEPKLWTIKEHRNDRYVIESNNIDGVPEVKVVDRNSIYYPNDSFVYMQKQEDASQEEYINPANFVNSETNSVPYNPLQQSQQSQQSQTPPQINFSPVFRIVQGDDNSNNTEPLDSVDAVSYTHLTLPTNREV